MKVRLNNKMKINQKNTIKENVVSTEITVDVLGTGELTQEKELELLHNFNKTIEYNKISFKSNMKITDNVPTITAEVISDSNADTIEEVKIDDLINKQHLVDENLNISFSIDITKIPDSALGTVFNTKEILGQAKVSLFAAKIKDAISEKLIEIRSLSNTFEGESEYTL